MKNKTTKGIVKLYLRWPFYIGLIFVIISGCCYFLDKRAGMLTSLAVVVYMFASFIVYRVKGPKVINSIMKYSANYDTVQNRLLKEMVTPYAVLDKDGAMLWANGEFLDIIGYDKGAKKSISSIFPELKSDVFPQNGLDSEVHIEHNDVSYKILMRDINIEDLFNDVEAMWDGEEKVSNNRFIAMYLYDETEIKRYIKENNEQKTVIALLYIDNYEEALESVDEVRRSLLVALIERKINKYLQNMDAIVKRLEKDKYVVVFKKKYLTDLQENRFDLLDEVRTINVGNELSVTLSMGIGVDAPTLQEGYEYARAAIDLALGRGGDQVVIKNNEKLLYYGGKSVQIEKATRVKARVKAHALKEIVEAKDEVMVMGHSIGDVDCFGASVGMYRIAKALGKKAYIVLDNVTTSLRPMLERVKSDPEYGEDAIIDNEKALELITANTVLIVVDVNKPNYTECPKLLEKTKNIIVLDHHRQTGEQIENAVLSYVEPFASSACEMVAEVLQYIGNGLKLKPAEADAMYAGVMIDTDGFQNKTGVRTFEAAAFLKRNGADVMRIRKAMRTDMKEYQIKAEAVKNAEIFSEHFAITKCEAKGLESPTVVGAQVANELLDISGVKASFVLTEYNEKIYISARSIDEVNVQIIMEKFGGGGHMSIAGAQMELRPIEDAKRILKLKVVEMLENGEI
ncbi:MAG: DHH family phosphoesterase [Lachnospiraceae bacterium]|nr:DHH family phosphoesterase [Lachnospiraceae bacterium]